MAFGFWQLIYFGTSFPCSLAHETDVTMMTSLREGGGGGVGDDGHGGGTAGVVFASPPRTRQSQHHLDVGKTPRMTNAGSGRGRAGLGPGKDDDGGVAIDDLTASLLGVHFLPFAYGDDGGASDNSALQNHHQQSDHSRSRQRDSDADLCFGDLEDNSTLTEDPADALARGRRRKSDKTKKRRVSQRKSTRRIKGAFRSIKKSIVRKPPKASSDGSGAVADTGTTSDDPSLSAELSRLQTDADEATRRAQALTGRIQAKTEEIAELEGRLASCREALVRDVSDLDRLRSDIGGLQRQRGALEQSDAAHVEQQEEPQRPEAVKRLSSFIRIHDLEELGEAQTGSARPDLADVHGSAIAPAVVEALARMAYDAATDDAAGRWTPSAETKKALSKQSDLLLDSTENTVAAGAPWIHVPPKEVFVWHGKFEHGGFGSDLPVVKARGIVLCSAQDLVRLLLDSTRTKEYNKMSIGRTDEHFFHRSALPGVTGEIQRSFTESEGAEANADDALAGGDYNWAVLPGETRILRSLSKPPMVKPVELLTLYHARELDVAAGQIDGYLIVSRSIWETECCVPCEGGGGGARTEMLLGAQLIRAVDGADRPQCELTTINHLSSKSIPMMMAKKIGLMTAASFIRDLQGVFE